VAGASTDAGVGKGAGASTTAGGTNDGVRLDAELLHDLVLESYCLVVAKMPRKDRPVDPVRFGGSGREECPTVAPENTTGPPRPRPNARQEPDARQQPDAPPLRRHQGEALEALYASAETGQRRSWIVLPPGAGKTRGGIDHAEHLLTQGLVEQVVAFGPNTAIQGQWASTWDRLAGDWCRAGTSRDLDGVFTALTYQSLAVFDEDREPGGSLLSELAPGGRDLVDGLVAGGPMLPILDECHHLLEVWGRLLSDLLELLPDVWVLGLTATPPARSVGSTPFRAALTAPRCLGAATDRPPAGDDDRAAARPRLRALLRRPLLRRHPGPGQRRRPGSVRRPRMGDRADPGRRRLAVGPGRTPHRVHHRNPRPRAGLDRVPRMDGPQVPRRPRRGRELADPEQAATRTLRCGAATPPRRSAASAARGPPERTAPPRPRCR